MIDDRPSSPPAPTGAASVLWTLVFRFRSMLADYLRENPQEALHPTVRAELGRTQVLLDTLRALPDSK